MNKSFKLALLTALSLNLGFSGCQNQSLTAPISTRIEPQQKSLKHNQVLIPNGLTLYSKDPNIILASSMPELLKKIKERVPQFDEKQFKVKNTEAITPETLTPLNVKISPADNNEIEFDITTRAAATYITLSGYSTTSIQGPNWGVFVSDISTWTGFSDPLFAVAKSLKFYWDKQIPIYNLFSPTQFMTLPDGAHTLLSQGYYMNWTAPESDPFSGNCFYASQFYSEEDQATLHKSISIPDLLGSDCLVTTSPVIKTSFTHPIPTPTPIPTPEPTAIPTPDPSTDPKKCGQSSGEFTIAAKINKCPVLLASTVGTCKRLDGTRGPLTSANKHYFSLVPDPGAIGGLKCTECPKGQTSKENGTDLFEGRKCVPLKCNSDQVPAPDGHSCMPKDRACDSVGLDQGKPITLFRYPKLIDFDTAGRDITLVFPVTIQAKSFDEAHKAIFGSHPTVSEAWRIILENAGSLGLSNQKQLVISTQETDNYSVSPYEMFQRIDKNIFNISIPPGQIDRGDRESLYFGGKAIEWTTSNPQQFPAFNKILKQVPQEVPKSALGYFVAAINSSYFANQVRGGKKTANLNINFNGHKMKVKLKLSANNQWTVVPCGG